MEFRYISRRLVRGAVQQHEAGQGEFGGAIGFDVDLGGVGSVTAQRRPPDYGNPFDLALRATAAVRGLTGAINQPDAYLRTTLTFLTKTCNVGLGWDDPTRDGWPITGFFADEDVGGMRVFVALFGSVTNLHAWQENGTPVGHYTPSDAAGLYLILNAVLEDEDPGISTNPVYQHREEIQSSPVERLWAARLMRGGSGRAFRPEPLEVLAQVFVCEHAVNIRHVDGDDLLTPFGSASRPPELDGDPYDLAIIGAPLWVATPEPEKAERYLAAKEGRTDDPPSASGANDSSKGKLRGILDRLRRSP